jgi:formylglycine-generating enzyme required for sulfatase activity
MALFTSDIPEIQFVTVPAGEFIMGQVDESFRGSGRELPAHPVYLKEYSIGRYPVTNSQYLCFIKDTGYTPPCTWLDGIFPEDKADHPVSGVTWSGAWLFCAWLRKKTGKPFHLPTEAQWEKAATWNQVDNKKQCFPWGDTWDDSLCNISSSGHKQTTPVGTYSPRGDSAYGCADMIGNVDEWCNSAMREYPYNASDGCEEITARGRRAIRGGDWYTIPPGSSIRRNAPSDWWQHLWGFRVCLSSAVDDAHKEFNKRIATMETKMENDFTAQREKEPDNILTYNERVQQLLYLRQNDVFRGKDLEHNLSAVLSMARELSALSPGKAEKTLGYPLFYAYYNRAMVREQLKDYENAYGDISKAIEMDSSDVDFFILRADIACGLGQVKQAEEDMSTVFGMNPEHPFLPLIRMKIAMAKEEWETADKLITERLNQYLFTPPSRFELHLWRGEIREQMGDLEKAVSDYYLYLLWYPDAPEKDTLTRKIQKYCQGNRE